MTRLIARLILAMLILPFTGTIVVVWMAAIATIVTAGPPPAVAILMMWVVVYAFVAIYWTYLWRDLICWNARRVRGTIAFGLVAIMSSALLCGLLTFGFGAPLFGAIGFGGGVAPIIWVLATVLIWRETPQERIERLSRLGAESISCPVCGYNMTGLRESRCPECGSQFTLDQLVASQPARDAKTMPDD